MTEQMRRARPRTTETSAGSSRAIRYRYECYNYAHDASPRGDPARKRVRVDGLLSQMLTPIGRSAANAATSAASAGTDADGHGGKVPGRVADGRRGECLQK